MPSLYSKLRLAVDSMDAMLLLERGVKCDAPCTEVVYLWHRGLALSVVTSTVDPTHLVGRLSTPRGSPSRCARRRQASELLFGAFPTVICSHGQERRSSARWEAVINASAAPYWETLVGQWGAARATSSWRASSPWSISARLAVALLAPCCYAPRSLSRARIGSSASAR